MGAAQFDNDRRWFPRVEIRREVTLITDDRRSIAAHTHDVSPGGLKLLCDRATAHALHPTGRYIRPGTGPRFYARLTLPVAGRELPLEAGCQMVYLEMIPEVGVAIGLEFKRFVGPGAEHLERFIAAAIEPA